MEAIYDDPIEVTEQGLKQAQARKDKRQKRIDRIQVNKALFELGKTYHQRIPCNAINEILAQNNFSLLEPGFYCGKQGRSNEAVGRDLFLHLSWYKMQSGNYEIVAYVN